MPRPLHDQVLVITGASSGIGRETCLQLAHKKARIVLAARNHAALEQVAEEVRQRGGEPLVCVTDVAQWDQVQRLAQSAIDRFGRVDTWINNAAVGTYATVEDLSIEEIDQTIRIDLLGPIYGVKAILPHMRRQKSGTLINVASVLADRSLPLMSTYCAAKHGLKGFTESLRVELKRERSGIAVSLILPASINTPFYNNARSKLGVKARPLPPVYAPETVAEAIVFAAQNPRRRIYVGGAGKMFAVLERISPSVVDWYLLQGDRAYRQMHSDQPDNGRDNLFTAQSEAVATRGGFDQETIPDSFYTRWFEFHPALKKVLLTAGLMTTSALVWQLGRRSGQNRR